MSTPIRIDCCGGQAWEKLPWLKVASPTPSHRPRWSLFRLSTLRSKQAASVFIINCPLLRSLRQIFPLERPWSHTVLKILLALLAIRILFQFRAPENNAENRCSVALR